jgi:hypothetical protein
MNINLNITWTRMMTHLAKAVSKHSAGSHLTYSTQQHLLMFMSRLQASLTSQLSHDHQIYKTVG